jgi:hypothetical protein
MWKIFCTSNSFWIIDWLDSVLIWVCLSLLSLVNSKEIYLNHRFLSNGYCVISYHSARYHIGKVLF